MSVVAARVHDRKIVVASDSIIMRGISKRNNLTKLESINGMIVGGTGTAEELTYMWQYMNTHQPASSSERDILDFVIEFSRWKNDMVGSPVVENEYVMAYQGRLFMISLMYVKEIRDFVAIGAGEDFANVALYLGHTPEEAVEVACSLSCYVSGPVVRYEMESQLCYESKQCEVKI